MRNFQGLKAPRPLALIQKDTQKRKSNSIRNHETARNTGRYRWMYKVWGTEEHNANHLGLAGDLDDCQGRKGGSGCVEDGFRQREEGTLGQENPWV